MGLYMPNPKEEIRRVLTDWPYNLQPDEAIEAASKAELVDGVWRVRLPAKAQQIQLEITRAPQ